MITISGNQFHLDGQPFRILFGGHALLPRPTLIIGRPPGEAARDGLNTVETYVAWNLHEPRPASFTSMAALIWNVI